MHWNTRSKEGGMVKIKLPLAALGVVAIALVAASSASAFTGPPVVNDLTKFTSDPEPGTWCGQVEGTAVDTVVEHFMQDASGNIVDNVNLRSVFTATATGKSIISSASNTTRTTGPIDNGDGTISFVTNVTGLVLRFQIPNGPVLKATNGEPIRGAGVLTTEDVFDAATGDYITTNESFSGPHPVREGVDICGPSVAYLLDP
jgi:hypothetical protein